MRRCTEVVKNSDVKKKRVLLYFSKKRKERKSYAEFFYESLEILP